MRKLFIYLSVIAIIAILGALTGWYFFLKGQLRATEGTDAARGFSVAAPFSLPTGSTFENMLSSFTGQSAAAPTSLSRLWHVDKTPVAGFAFDGTDASTTLSLVERGNGYVFVADPGTQTIARVTNTLMPKTYEALFAQGGKVVERSLDSGGNITTFVGSIGTSTTMASTTALSGKYLEKNILSVLLQPITGELFLIEGAEMGFEGHRMQWDGKNPKTLFASGMGDWSGKWLSDGRLVIFTKPADGIQGFAYLLRNDGTMGTLVRALPGLTILPRASSSALIYGTSTGSSLSLFAKSSESAPALALPVRTIADKCVWAPGQDLIAYCAVPATAPTGTYLNDRYKGLSHTSDAWWRIDASSGSAEIFYTPDERVSLDVADPIIDASGMYIAFKNAADDSLWLLRLEK